MAQQKQARLQIYFDGVKIDTATAITLSTDGGKTPVYTLDLGLIGFSLGSGQITGTVENAMPAAGQVFPFQQKVCADETVLVQVVLGAEHYAGEGQLMTDEKSQTVNAAASGTVTFTAEKQPVS
jgi:hypothetical protein